MHLHNLDQLTYPDPITWISTYLGLHLNRGVHLTQAPQRFPSHPFLPSSLFHLWGQCIPKVKRKTSNAILFSFKLTNQTIIQIFAITIFLGKRICSKMSRDYLKLLEIFKPILNWDYS